MTGIFMKIGNLDIAIPREENMERHREKTGTYNPRNTEDTPEARRGPGTDAPTAPFEDFMVLSTP